MHHVVAHDVSIRRTTADVFSRLPDTGRTSQYDPERDRYGSIGTVNQGQRKVGKEDPEGEYKTADGGSINATKVIKLLADENHGKFSLIATQCPLSYTLNDFLGLIYNSSVDAVVVLGSLEPGRLNDYWSSKRTVRGPDHLEVDSCYELESKRKFGGSGYKKYEITVNKYVSKVKKGAKKLILFHYYEWPDKDTPKDGDHFEKFVKLKDFENKRKLLVHCSAGVGRTGTFAACLQAWKEKRKDPFEIVKELRGHRTKMVQTAQQFDYVCKFIARNCAGGGKKIGWSSGLDYDEYFGVSEAEVRK